MSDCLNNQHIDICTYRYMQTNDILLHLRTANIAIAAFAA